MALREDGSWYCQKCGGAEMYSDGRCKPCRRTKGRVYEAAYKERHPGKQKSTNVASRQRKLARGECRDCSRPAAPNRKQCEEHLRRSSTASVERVKSNPEVKLASALRNRLNVAINGAYKSGSAVRDLGCSIDEFKKYLESKFQPGMSWDNWGRDGWHIDHIKPLASFDLTDREQFLQACHHTNLQPLWAEENLKKSDKLPESA